MSNWTSSFLASKYGEGEKEASIKLKTILARTSLNVMSQHLVYDLPAECIGISRITYRGTRLYPITLQETIKFYNANLYGEGFQEGAFEDDAFVNAFLIGIEGTGTTTGRPTHFIYSTLGYKKIGLFPIPSEDLAASSGNLYTGTEIQNHCIVEYVRLADSNIGLPSYIKDPMCKYYTLYKALAIEGKGQDLQASAIYKDLYEIELNRAKLLLKAQFGAHEKEFDPNNSMPTRLGSPRLPWNYGQVVD